MRDFYDPDELRRVYYPEMERLIAERRARARARLRPHPAHQRRNDRAARKIREPVLGAQRLHRWSGPKRVRDSSPTRRRR